MEPHVAIIDFHSQYTLLIARTLREIGARSVILNPANAMRWLKENPPRAIILSGGDASVYDENAPQLPGEVLSLRREDGQPIAILGICYGMQWLAHHLGGEVKPVSDNREYGEASVKLHDSGGNFFLDTPENQKVWMSHGDSVTKLPEGFNALAYSDTGTIAAMQRGLVFGVQFHPEVTHTSHGKTMIANFLKLAQCVEDWTPSSIIASIREDVVSQLGNEKAIFGFSGGVDSTTLATILAPVLKERLLAVTIDGGNLREGEIEEIKMHASVAGVNLRIMDARGEFQEAMTSFLCVDERWSWFAKFWVFLLNWFVRRVVGYVGVVDAEEKRRRFKMIYTSLLVRVARDFGATVVLQGTLAPDRIESGSTGGVTIKSHHNVGLDMGDLRQLHPFEGLFKYEVRALAKELGLPESVWNRQPSPGPALFIRVIGVPATPDRLDIVRWADARVREILVKNGIYEQISQLVVAYLGLNTVGVKGDARTYRGSIGIRAVETIDFMTARGIWFPEHVVSEISRTVTSHPGIVQASFWPTDKPPATIEFE